MWKKRPAIVVSYKNTLRGPCTVIPTTTEAENASNPWAHQLSISLEGNSVTSWAICNHPATLSPSRFTQFNEGIIFLPKHDFNAVLKKLIAWLPQPFVT
jgi:mRNA interferase MazF